MTLRPVELQVTTNFSFLQGGSRPHELAAQAAALGYKAIGVTDRNTLAGIVRAFDGCEKASEQIAPIRLIVGCRLDLEDAPSLLCYPEDRAAYGRLCTLLTRGKLRTEKAKCSLTYRDVLDHRSGLRFVALAPERLDAGFAEFLQRLRKDIGRNAHLAASYLYRGDDARRIRQLAELAGDNRLPLIATNDVLYHVPERRPLQDVVTCIREHVTIDEAGFRLLANAERHLKSPEEMRRLFKHWPQALENAAHLADACRFSLSELQYDYPSEPVPDGRTPQQQLEHLTWEGAAKRYPAGVPDNVRQILRSELRLIERLNYAPYFLTVQDIVQFAESRGILCQGRGSAANSLVCYCLRITAIGLDQANLLFERFVSSERNEPPDIDVDFEHERREEVIQYIYDKYGRDRAGIAATVISYRSKSALREVGKVFGLSDDVLNRLSKSVWGWGDTKIAEKHIAQSGLDLAGHRLNQVLALAGALIGFPRHLSQHVGGFVITRGSLHNYVPIENAAMKDRTFIEWDKDDLDTLRMLKIDVLALGMLTCLRKGFELLERHENETWTLATVPKEQPDVYDMLCKADSIGVFQVESRAQMSMLPRLKPRKFYDLVIEVAIVRPGPIQGDMVHPYLRRRDGLEAVVYPSDDLKEVLKETYGIPLFQEHAMRIAMVAAGFTAEESDKLRRAMATFRRSGTIGQLRDKFIEGMVARNYTRDFAERCFKQIEGFADYGFPESHAASFALLVYVSAWMKCRHPAVFACAILNAQPMGFYAPAQLVRDAREHGVEVRPVDVNASEWDNTLERTHDGKLALRLGFREIAGCRQQDIARLIAARGDGYRTLHELWRKTGLGPAALETLAKADAYGSLFIDRRRALWQIHTLDEGQLPLFDADDGAMAGRGWPSHIPADDLAAPLPEMSLGEQILEDYHAIGMSLRAHPVSLLRCALDRIGIAPNKTLAGARNGERIKVAGLVLVRQRPGTASGVIFMTLEDDCGIANIGVWPKIFEAHRRIVLGGRMVAVEGKLQREGLVIHVIAERITDLTPLLRTLGEEGHDTDRAIARGDEVKHATGGDQRLRVRSRDFH
ncbi:MAG TPA: error-prone DNA polymerase [Dongiaceae bacterium]|nr:error-prone DNA polymerase [Dongiaceae bacterium]